MTPPLSTIGIETLSSILSGVNNGFAVKSTGEPLLQGILDLSLLLISSLQAGTIFLRGRSNQSASPADDEEIDKTFIPGAKLMPIITGKEWDNELGKEIPVWEYKPRFTCLRSFKEFRADEDGVWIISNKTAVDELGNPATRNINVPSTKIAKTAIPLLEHIVDLVSQMISGNFRLRDFMTLKAKSQDITARGKRDRHFMYLRRSRSRGSNEEKSKFRRKGDVSNPITRKEWKNRVKP